MESSGTPVLSICIPTHHGRAEMLADAIEGVIRQVPADRADEVEICVSDNASQDRTELLVARRAAASRIEIIYNRAERDRGAPANLLRSVTLARGKWCWLLGSDDAIAPGGVSRAIEILEADPGLAGATVNRAAYDSELREALPEPHPWIVPPPRTQGHEVLRSTVDVFQRIGLLLAFQSTQIVNRQMWKRAIDELGPKRLVRAGTVPHVWIIATMLADPGFGAGPHRPAWAWCAEQLVWQRTGTAELGGHGGSMARFMISVSRDISRALRYVPDLPPATRRELLERWRREVARPLVIEAVRRQQPQGRRDDLRLLVGYGRVFGRLPGFWRETAPAVIRRSLH